MNKKSLEQAIEDYAEYMVNAPPDELKQTIKNGMRQFIKADRNELREKLMNELAPLTATIRYEKKYLFDLEPILEIISRLFKCE